MRRRRRRRKSRWRRMMMTVGTGNTAQGNGDVEYCRERSPEGRQSWSESNYLKVLRWNLLSRWRAERQGERAWASAGASCWVPAWYIEVAESGSEDWTRRAGSQSTGMEFGSKKNLGLEGCQMWKRGKSLQRSWRNDLRDCSEETLKSITGECKQICHGKNSTTRISWGHTGG